MGPKFWEYFIICDSDRILNYEKFSNTIKKKTDKERHLEWTFWYNLKKLT